MYLCLRFLVLTRVLMLLVYVRLSIRVIFIRRFRETSEQIYPPLKIIRLRLRVNLVGFLVGGSWVLGFCSKC